MLRCQMEILRAGDRTRTGDVQLGKLAFYQLNYARVRTVLGGSLREPDLVLGGAYGADSR
jgi:hypothetical protein